MFDIEFSRTWTDIVRVFYAPISIDATMFSVEYRKTEAWEAAGQQPFVVIAVDDLDTAMRELCELGGEEVGERFELPIYEEKFSEYEDFLTSHGMHPGAITPSVGTMARLRDPSGNIVNLMQPDPHSQYAFRTGLYKIGISHAQWLKWQNELALTKSLQTLTDDIQADRTSDQTAAPKN
ncbi:VOC family protein [Nocardia sp. NPDC051570]|uniref:VOC family protein n=1 Tax=Nocardia sp. NPDC051570 TaxID=3364324 RepID=UPI00379984E1